MSVRKPPAMSVRKSIPTMAELARRVGVTRSHMLKIYNGDRCPSLPVAVAIAKALGISMDRLLRSLPQEYLKPRTRKSIKRSRRVIVIKDSDDE